MHPKRFALIIGIVFLAVGILSFIPALNVMPAEGLPPLRMNMSYGLFLGYFAMNVVNKVLLIVFGLSGILASQAPTTNLPSSIKFSRWTFAVMGILSILGMLPQTDTLFGYAPLYGNQVWLYGIYSLLGGYFGYMLTSKVPDQGDRNPRTNAPLHSGAR